MNCVSTLSHFSTTRTAAQIMANVLVVGGGLTSGLTTSLLAEGQNAPINLSVWDKARGCGGRMSTSRSPSNPNCTADLGAQYITATPKFLAEHKKFYDELKMKNLLKPLSSDIEGRKPAEPGTVDYVMPEGSSSIVKHFFAKSGIRVQFDQFVETVRLDGKKWSVTTKSGRSEHFDCVVLTMPVPQILQVAAEFLAGKPDLKSKLESVTYSSRYGLALFYDSDRSASVTLGDNVSARYITDPESVFRFVAVDNVKRNSVANGEGTSVVLHTSVPFGVEHVEKTPDQVRGQLVSEAEKLFPDWPKPDNIKCQKWRYSQVANAFPGAPGCVVLNEDPLLIAGGDGFVHSNVDGCVTSAEKIVAAVRQTLAPA